MNSVNLRRPVKEVQSERQVAGRRVVGLSLPLPSWGDGTASSLEAETGEFRSAWKRSYASLTGVMPEPHCAVYQKAKSGSGQTSVVVRLCSSPSHREHAGAYQP